MFQNQLRIPKLSPGLSFILQDFIIASLYLAARVCESPIRLSHIIPLSSFAHQEHNFHPLSVEEYFTKRTKVLDAESVKLQIT